MKRSGPPRRKTALRRSTKRLPRVSEKRRAENEQRRDVCMIVRARDRLCVAQQIVPEIRCGGPLDVDEIIPRGRGGSELDPANCQLLCRRHHDWKHAEPAEAERLGLTRSVPPPI